jgi:hypothetical protein
MVSRLPTRPARETRAPQRQTDSASMLCGAAVPATHPQQPSVAVAMGGLREGGWLAYGHWLVRVSHDARRASVTGWKGGIGMELA